MNLNTQRMSRAASKARTRQALLDSARAVFEEKGFNAATVEEIVERAGFTRGAFYANFADKADALWEVVGSFDRSTFEQVESALEDVPTDAKLEVVQDWFTSMRAHRPLQRALEEALMHGGGSEETKARLAGLQAQNRAAIVRTVEATAEQLGVELPIPSEHLALLIFAVGNGLGQQAALDDDLVPPNLFSDALAYLWLGVMATAADPSLLTRSGTSTPTPPAKGRRRS
jgi:AcrR family transcriptional regulator